jgi:hypothetical protein
MSDVSSGARAPDANPGVDVPTGVVFEPAYPAGSASADDSKAKQVAGQSKEAAAQAASDVKDTAREQAQRVGAEAKTQARNVASDVRDRVSEQARTQNDKLVGDIRQMADHLDEMRGDRQDSPAATVVSRVADSGRQMADYLDRNGPEGVLREVQDFARRRPGAFLATALAAGFVVGRLGKGVAKADPGAGDSKPRGDSFVSRTPDTGYRTGTTGYADPAPATTGYPSSTSSTSSTLPTSSTEYAATGTGTPVVVEEDYVFDSPERRP